MEQLRGVFSFFTGNQFSGRLFSVLIVLVTSVGFLESKHIIGGEVTYECMGPGSGPNTRLFQITMKIYRDCDPGAGGAGFDTPAYFSFYRGTEAANSFYNSVTINNVDITRIVPDTPKCIQNIPFVCVEEGIYRFDVELPVINESYFIVYQRCCRNNSILNIYTPESIGATYSVEITAQAQALCNDSPVFNEFPPLIICKDSPLDFNHSATDADGDQLVYRFCAPENGGGPVLTNPGYTECGGAQPIPPCPPPFDPVPYIQPTYSATNPMGGNPQVVVHPVTGLISGTPIQVGRYVVGVCVDEYRNGDKLSTVRRDFQFNVADCDPTVLVRLDGGDSLIYLDRTYYLKSCGGKEVYINNTSLDPNFINTFEWNFDLQGTPYFNDVDWSPLISFPDTGVYVGKLVLNPGSECSDSAGVVVRIFPGVETDFSYSYDTCVAGPVQFTNLTVGEAGGLKWSWQFGVPNGISTERDPSFIYPVPGNLVVTLEAIDTNYCREVLQKPITYLPAPATVIVRPSSFVGCLPGEITFENLSIPLDSTYQVEWTFGDGASSTGVISPTHTYTSPGVYSVNLSITSPIGCTVSDSFSDLIRVVPSPVADFSYAPSDPTSLEPTVAFMDLSKDADRWFWQFDRYGISNQQNPVFQFPDTGLVRVLLVVTHPEGCKDSISRWMDVSPEVRWFMPNAFTPNGDGSNDVFAGKGSLEGATNFNMTIWNRWGELVFETDNPFEAWTGRAQQTGGLSPAGVYVYLVQFKDPRGQLFEYKGFVTLIR